MSSSVPDGWSAASLGELCKFSGGSAFKEKYQGKSSGQYPFIKVSDMNLTGNERFIKNANHWIDESIRAEAKVKLFPPLSVVFAKVGAALLLNRRRILIRDTAIDNNMMAAIPNSNDNNFLYYVLQEIDLGEIVQGGAVPSINQAQMEDIPALIPPLPEQQKIATILSSVDKVIETTRAQIDKLKDLKTGMMQELLTKGIGADGVPHTEFKDSPVGRIPVGWEVAEANELCVKITKGTTPPKSKYVDDKKIPFLRVNNLGFDNQLHFENELLYLSPEIQNGFLARSKVYPNDILMNIVGPPLGKIALVTDDFSEYNINQAIIIYRPIMDKIGYRFLLHYLTSNIAQDWLKVRSKKTSGQQNLTIELCKELPIPSPPLAEQEKISAILDSSDSMIQINKMKLNSLQNLKKALMQDLLTGKVRVTIDETEKEPAVA